MDKNHILTGVNLYYPSARDWMWDYCMYLGPYVDSNGEKYDLGVFVNTGFDDTDEPHYSAAIVYGNEPGEYISGELEPQRFTGEHYTETIRRCKELNLL